MDSFINGSIAYCSSVFTVFALYPYRDFVKQFDLDSFRKLNYVNFAKYRYRGMLENPSQPLLLAAPQGFLYFGYVLGGGNVLGALLGGVLHGNAKMCVATVARRMSGGDARYRGIENKGYSSIANCVMKSGKHFGFFSFFAGGAAASLISMLWHGSTLVMLQRSYSGEGFFSNTFSAFSAHAFMTFLTTPVRNVFRSSLSSVERSGGVKSAQAYILGEGAIFREAVSVGKNAFFSGEIRFFLNGVLQTTFKTSVPFAVTYGIFKWAGGSIGYPGNRGPSHLHPRRSMLRTHY
ncbi:hypothetical protein AGDE_01731 [Angomonas deanei]|uniref:Mitochondrial carrier protein n=1 Tax=Angomonas deanei TaxID=59799 RepID=A0A7G2C7E1_9TRYP|nr:hypothetical protein AGDE_01731 [Angomonas deanei]CAD2214673.1 hypothetical protein, conserved [Angomonas deanei]|eukprot:EPY42192.1 hypothetical protein AGDE_01731 [Angomonas deanei]